MNLKSILVLSLTFFVNVSLGQTFSGFYQYSPGQKRIDGINYPRNHMTLYRGTTDHQMDLTRGMQALFRDTSANVESFFFSTIKYALMGLPFAKSIELSGYLKGQISDERNAAGGNLSNTEAIQKTIELVDGTFDYYGKGNNISTHVNYNSGTYNDWPVDMVFTTIIQPAAATYGDKVLVIKEASPRSIDLNFWNFVNNGKWYDHTRDAGEFITHGYILFSDIDGYRLQSGRAKGFYSIDEAFYRVEVAGEIFVLVLDTNWDVSTPSTCIERLSDYDFVHCRYRPGTLALTPPTNTTKKVKLKGVLTLCSDRASCLIPSDIVQSFQQKSSANFNRSLIKKLESMKIHGKSLYYFPSSSL